MPPKFSRFGRKIKAVLSNNRAVKKSKAAISKVNQNPETEIAFIQETGQPNFSRLSSKNRVVKSRKPSTSKVNQDSKTKNSNAQEIDQPRFTDLQSKNHVVKKRKAITSKVDQHPKTKRSSVQDTKKPKSLDSAYNNSVVKRRKATTSKANQDSKTESSTIQDIDQHKFFDLPYAPIFHPTEEEFQDPIAYIATITPQAEKAGICKIVPPSGFKPKFALNKKTFKFKTKKQDLKLINGVARMNDYYQDQLLKFHNQYTTPIITIPLINNRPIDPYTLTRLINQYGGVDEISTNNKWCLVGEKMNLSIISESSATKLKDFYSKFIEPFEDHKKHYKNLNHQLNLSSINVNPGDCHLCFKGDEMGAMLICDGCEKTYHLSCLEPKLPDIPKSDWFCPFCFIKIPNEDVIEDGEEYTLESFENRAKLFQSYQFINPINRNVLEREYWSNLSDLFSSVQVEHAVDLHSTAYGSGFHTIHQHPDKSMSQHPWNLNNFSTSPNSLFSNFSEDISGMTTPWINIGMCFSTLCWKNEDHYAYSVDYQHLGETKTWYGIPGSHADDFRKGIEHLLPELFDQKQDGSHRLNCMISPDILQKNNIPVYTMDQKPNEFVITFPKAYHASFSHGFTVNETVNFAPVEWMRYGFEYVKEYKKILKCPIFSYDELLLKSAEHNPQIFNTEKKYQILEEIFDRDSLQKSKIQTHLGHSRTKRMISDELSQCLNCNEFCYLRAMGCQCQLQVVCSDHLDLLCDCPSNLKFNYQRYEDPELESLFKKLWVQTRESTIFNNILEQTLQAEEYNPFSFYQDLFNQVVLAGNHDEEDKLKTFVSDCEKLLVMARGYLNQSQDITTMDCLERDVFVQDIKELTQEADRRRLQSDSIDALKNLITLENSITHEIIQALSNPQIDIEILRDLKNKADSLGIDNEYIEELKSKLQSNDWVQNVKSLITKDRRSGLTLDILSNALNMAMKIIPDQITIINEMRFLQKFGKKWKLLANQTITSTQINLDDVDYCIKQTHYYPHDPKVLTALSELNSRYATQREQADLKLQQSKNPKFVDRPQYEAIQNMLNELDSLDVTSKAILKLSEMKKQVDDWIQTVSDAFGMGSETTSLIHILHNLKLIKLKLKCRVEKKTAFTCPCGLNPYETTEVCKKCSRQFHRECLDMASIPNEERYCVCCSKGWTENIKKRPTFNQVSQLVHSGMQLPFQCLLFVSLSEILQVMQIIKERCEKFRNIADPKEFEMEIKKLALAIINLEITIDSESQIINELLSHFQFKRIKSNPGLNINSSQPTPAAMLPTFISQSTESNQINPPNNHQPCRGRRLSYSNPTLPSQNRPIVPTNSMTPHFLLPNSTPQQDQSLQQIATTLYSENPIPVSSISNDQSCRSSKRNFKIKNRLMLQMYSQLAQKLPQPIVHRPTQPTDQIRYNSSPNSHQQNSLIPQTIRFTEPITAEQITRSSTHPTRTSNFSGILSQSNTAQIVPQSLSQSIDVLPSNAGQTLVSQSMQLPTPLDSTSSSEIPISINSNNPPQSQSPELLVDIDLSNELIS